MTIYYYSNNYYSKNVWYVPVHFSDFKYVHIVVNSSDADRGDLRLVGGISTAGRLEMQLDGEWTAVCSFRFSATSASLACSQMGLGSTGTVLTDGRLVHVLWYLLIFWSWWFK